MPFSFTGEPAPAPAPGSQDTGEVTRGQWWYSVISGALSAETRRPPLVRFKNAEDLRYQNDYFELPSPEDFDYQNEIFQDFEVPRLQPKKTEKRELVSPKSAKLLRFSEPLSYMNPLDTHHRQQDVETFPVSGGAGAGAGAGQWNSSMWCTTSSLPRTAPHVSRVPHHVSPLTYIRLVAQHVVPPPAQRGGQLVHGAGVVGGGGGEARVAPRHHPLPHPGPQPRHGGRPQQPRPRRARHRGGRVADVDPGDGGEGAAAEHPDQVRGALLHHVVPSLPGHQADVVPSIKHLKF